MPRTGARQPFHGKHSKVTASVRDGNGGTTVILDILVTVTTELGAEVLAPMPKRSARGWYQAYFADVEAVLSW